MRSSKLLGPTGIVRADVESVVASAGRAPSIHNTQPWRWVFHDDVLDLRADRTRQLHVADRDGHSLLVSCGAAAELTHLGFRAQGWALDSALVPDPADPDLLARFTVTGRGLPDSASVLQLGAARGRRSERRPFGELPVPPAVVDHLRDTTTSTGAHAHFVSRPDEFIELAVAVDRADRFEHDDPAFAAELASWRRTGSGDGVPDSSIPILGYRPRHADVPLRDFEAGVPGSQLMRFGADERPLLAVILTDSDRAADRLQAGLAMMRLMLRAELGGISSCPLSQSVDLLSFRSRLRALMGWTGYPQMMLRLGWRPTGEPAPLTPRRPVADVLTFA